MVNKRVKIAGNEGTCILKLIALAMMFCDHAGKMLYGNNMDLRVLGRIAFPLYAWCLVVGAHHTRSMWKYILRVLLMFVVSQPLYIVALNHSWREPNVFLTLALGLAGIWGLKEKKLLSQIWAPMLAISGAVLLKADYGWMGVLLMLLLWAVRDSRPGIAAVMIPFCLLWSGNTRTITSFFGLRLTWIQQTPVLSTILPRLPIQLFAIFALPLMLIRLPNKPRMPMWLSYAIYPMHLVVLTLMEGQMLQKGWADVLARYNERLIGPVIKLLSDWPNITTFFSNMFTAVK